MKNPIRFGRIMAICCILLSAISLRAQITGTGTTLSVNASSATVIDPAIVVSGSTSITNVTVQISTNFYAGDALSYDASLAATLGITGEYTTMSNATGILYLTGTTTPANWQALLRTVSFQNASAACGPSTREIVFMPGRVLQNLYNGHYYEFVSGSYTWKEAKTAAAQRSYNGMQGYLATSTSAGENNFVWKLMNADAWVGATYDRDELLAAGITIYADQAAANGKVYWVTGPEKGMFLSSGLGTPVAQNGAYMNWNSGEPNNYNGTNEFYTQLYSQQQGRWNDLPISSKLSLLVEYGGMPGDVPQNITYSRQLSLTNTVGGEITGGNISVCSGTNSTVLTTTAAVPGVTITRWEYSYDNFLTAGVPIAHTGSTYTATNLTQTTYFRTIANGNSCSGAPSSSTRIEVGSTVAGSLSANYSSLCNGSSASISLTGNTGDVLKWQVSNDNSNWSDIAHTGVVYNTPNLATGTYYYRAEVRNASCPASAFTASLAITVSAGSGSVSGSLSGTSSLCGTTNNGSLSLSGQTGNVLKWQKSIDNGIIWTDISNTTTTLNIVNQTVATKYRAQVQNASCNPVFTDAYTVGHFSYAFTWLGSTSTDFGTASNWSCEVPGAGDPILISASAPNMPVLDQNRTLGNIVFEDNTSLDLNGYNLIVNGTITSPATGRFRGGIGSSLALNGLNNPQGIYFDQSNPGTSNYLESLTINKEQVITTGGTGHCTPTGSNNVYGMGITRVQLGSIDKTSTAPTTVSAAYTNNFATDITELSPSTAYTLTVKTGSASYTQKAQAWIDWNDDGDFNDANELLATSASLAGGTSIALNFTSPAIGAEISGGVKRMRIAGEFSSVAATNCSVQYGEIEDYQIHFLPLPTLNGELVIGNKLVLGSELILTKGLLKLNNQDLQLGAGVSIQGAAADKYVQTNGTGRLYATLANGQSLSLPVGNSAYNPVTITNNTGSADLFGVKVLDEAYRNGQDGDVIAVGHVARTWDISKQLPNGGAGVNFQFNWNDGEAPALSNPLLFHHNGSNWERLTGTTNRVGNTLSYSGYTGGFSPFAVAENNFTLPVQWLSFTASRLAQSVQLRWTTGEEINAKDFVIQHSADGQNWQDLAIQDAIGSSRSVNEYAYLHQQPLKGDNYYRILQRDQDGRSSYSVVRKVQLTADAEKFRLLGNPVSNGQIRVFSPQAQVLRLFAADGRLVWQGTVAAGTHSLATGKLAPGIYSLRYNESALSISILP